MAELLSSAEISQYLSETADLLGDNGPTETIIMVGGALLTHRGIREGTRDVDSVRRLSEQLKAAAAEVAKRHDLAPDWLNSTAAAFRPRTLEETDCELVLGRGRLIVLAAPLDQVFLMKLNSNRATDQADLVLAWPRTSFETAREVVDAYWEAFPSAPEDEFLIEYVTGIISDSPTEK